MQLLLACQRDFESAVVLVLAVCIRCAMVGVARELAANIAYGRVHTKIGT